MSPLKRLSSDELDLSFSSSLESNIKGILGDMERRLMNKITDQRAQISCNCECKKGLVGAGDQEELDKAKEILSEQQKQIEFLNFKLDHIMNENNKIISLIEK